ncbi:acyltransferase family protein [Actinomadura sp. 21ATH]|uniref:acyltransferase family protein n=1 Tax=Actinomadura sp. 21ATH TaxID=1735444 RepID=UPI0035C13531
MTSPRLAPAVPAVPAASAPPAAKKRDAYFDNAKFVTAVLVVLGHVWAEFGDSHAVDAAYKAVYAFHMPVFVFITGYFSRSLMRNPQKFRTMLPTLVVPYLIFIVLYRGQIVLLLGKPFDLNEFLMPHFLMWFLVAMVCWRLSAPLWDHLRHPVAVAVVGSLLSGMWIFGEEPTMSRMAGLLPFFVLGLMIEPERLQALRRPAARWAGAAVLVAAVPAIYVWESGLLGVPGINMDLLWWNSSYRDMGYSALVGMSGRAAALLLAVILGTAFLAVIPRRHTWFTEMGTRTMYVYLLHGLVVKTFDYTGVLAEPVLHTPLGIVGVTLAAVALALLLSTGAVQRLTRPAIEPKARWLLKPQHGRGT